jgi:cell fate (sporulation/competence/biofilm development) regulator YlbF (YheA/YmcA/DUF963 family)
MSIETDAATEEAEDVESLARTLGEAITDLPVYEEFEDRKAEVEASEEAQELIEEFDQIREEFMVARETGQATQEDLRELQEAQERLHDVPEMAAFLQAQNDLELRLQSLNEEISDQLAVDFGETAGGCCQD